MSGCFERASQIRKGELDDEMDCSNAIDFRNDPEWGDDMLYAFEIAASCMAEETFPGDNPERQNAAFREVAKRIRAMARRYNLSISRR